MAKIVWNFEIVCTTLNRMDSVVHKANFNAVMKLFKSINIDENHEI